MILCGTYCMTTWVLIRAGILIVATATENVFSHVIRLHDGHIEASLKNNVCTKSVNVTLTSRKHKSKRQ